MKVAIETIAGHQPGPPRPGGRAAAGPAAVAGHGSVDVDASARPTCPGRRIFRRARALSIEIRTGTRWTTLTKLPVAFCGGRSWNACPAPRWIETTWPVKSTSGKGVDLDVDRLPGLDAGELRLLEIRGDVEPSAARSPSSACRARRSCPTLTFFCTTWPAIGAVTVRWSTVTCAASTFASAAPTCASADSTAGFGGRHLGRSDAIVVLRRLGFGLGLVLAGLRFGVVELLGRDRARRPWRRAPCNAAPAGARCRPGSSRPGRRSGRGSTAAWAFWSCACASPTAACASLSCAFWTASCAIGPAGSILARTAPGFTKALFSTGTATSWPEVSGETRTMSPSMKASSVDSYWRNRRNSTSRRLRRRR